MVRQLGQRHWLNNIDIDSSKTTSTVRVIRQQGKNSGYTTTTETGNVTGTDIWIRN